MPGRGLGAAAFAGYDLDEESLINRPDTDTQSAAALNDYFWGGGPPVPAQIPYSWLSQPLRFRPDPPITLADVTQSGGTSARKINATSRAEYGEFAAQPITLSTTCDADPANLAAHTVGNYANPRMRCPQLTLDLLQRTDVERWLILAQEVGSRIRVTGAPATWPEGTTSLVIEGVHHEIGIDQRVVTWNTAPVIGATPGVAGPWFRLDDSTTDIGSDLVPF